MQLLEIWKDIQGYEGLYSINNYGVVKSINRNIFLKNTPDKKGYLYVSLYKNNKESKFKVHRLVSEHFIDNPLNFPQVDHIDRNKANNIVTNLRWANNSMNAHNTAPRKTGTSKYKGVSLDKSAVHKKWKAIVSIDKKNYHLGRFLTELEAHIAVNNFKSKNQLL